MVILKRCFGIISLEFASHPDDEMKAEEWADEMAARKATWADAKNEFNALMDEWNVTDNHRKRQNKKFLRLVKPKL